MVNWTLGNPVVTKELRGRMRGARTYWLLFGYLFLLSLLFFFWYLGWWSSHSNAMQNGAASASFTAGRMFFKVLFYAQAVMIALITPALTAGAISVEREQRTFEMLRSTVLKPRSIVWGKLVSCHRFMSGARDVTSVRPLTGAELGSVFGRDHVVHVAITPGRLAEALMIDATRLSGLSGRADDGGKDGPAGGSRRGRTERIGE